MRVSIDVMGKFYIKLSLPRHVLEQ